MQVLRSFSIIRKMLQAGETLKKKKKILFVISVAFVTSQRTPFPISVNFMKCETSTKALAFFISLEVTDWIEMEIIVRK